MVSFSALFPYLQLEDSSLTKFARDNDLGGPQTTIAGFCSAKPCSQNVPPHPRLHTHLPNSTIVLCCSIHPLLLHGVGDGEPGVFCMLGNCQAMSSGSFGFRFLIFVVVFLRQGLIKLPKLTLNSLCCTNSLLIHDPPALASRVPVITVLFN